MDENEEVVAADFLNDGDEDLYNINMSIAASSQLPCAFFVWYNAGQCTSARTPHTWQPNDKRDYKKAGSARPLGDNKTNNTSSFNMRWDKGAPDLVACRCKVGIQTESQRNPSSEPDYDRSTKRRRNKRLPLIIEVTCLERNIRLESLSADTMADVVPLALPRGQAERGTSSITCYNDKSNTSFLGRLGADYDSAICVRSSRHRDPSRSESWWNEVVFAGSEIVIGKIKKMVEACISHYEMTNNMYRNRGGHQLNEEMLRALSLQDRAKKLIMKCSVDGHTALLNMGLKLKTNGKPKSLVVKHVKANPFRDPVHGAASMIWEDEDLEDLSELSDSLSDDD
eukprot:Tbor_TRINITY_DN2307_c0_g1::TRINITY_DN2307_c0_g1_i1::g.174::m.174